MKKIAILLYAAMLLSAVSITAAASPVSPGLDVIAAEQRMVKTGSASMGFSFSEEDFTRAIGTFEHISVTSLPDPAQGKLMYGDVEATVNQRLSGDDISKLRFVGSEGCTESCFSFSPDDSYTATCSLILTDRVNFPPAAGSEEDLAVWTQGSVSVSGKLTGHDPENDSVIFEICKYPQSGSLLSFDKSTGEYCYMPDEGFTGKDSFSYCVKDEYGAYSDEENVDITVDRRIFKDVIADVEGQKCENNVLCAVGKGLMEVSEVDGGKLFYPSAEVSRLDFLVMTMDTLNAGGMPSFESTAFADDELIPTEYKSYAECARQLGIIKGVETDGSICFQPDRSITAAEAAVILERIIGSGDTNVAALPNDSTVPAWASSAYSAMCSAGIIEISDFSGAGASLTRGTVAGILNHLSASYT